MLRFGETHRGDRCWVIFESRRSTPHLGVVESRTLLFLHTLRGRILLTKSSYGGGTNHVAIRARSRFSAGALAIHPCDDRGSPLRPRVTRHAPTEPDSPNTMAGACALFSPRRRRRVPRAHPAGARLGDRAAPRRRRNPGAFPERRRFRLRASRPSSTRASLTSSLSRHPCHLEIRLRLPPPQARVDFPTASACPAAPPAAPCLPA